MTKLLNEDENVVHTFAGTCLFFGKKLLSFTSSKKICQRFVPF
jgi:hypothetical protein